MPVTEQTTNRQGLIDLMVKGFTALGYVYSANLESPRHYFARVLNGLVGGTAYTISNTTISRTLELIATNLNILPKSYLVRTQTQLFVDICNGLEGQPPVVTDRLALEDGTGFWLWQDGSAIQWPSIVSDSIVL